MLDHVYEDGVTTLRELRERRLMTQQELADRAGLTQTQVCRIETGKARPRFGTIRKLARALGVRPEELVGAK